MSTVRYLVNVRLPSAWPVKADYDMLGILDSHLFHILLCPLYHKLIAQALFVFGFKAYGYVADWLTDPWIKLYLDLEAFGSDIGIIGNDTV